ncbi:hypothetical protein [Streptomyces sp. NPDC020480]|uniref:hypothetical protein n=1 Tax=Streptomyces sp. NPDC020480 TaxID=3365076 RepID=UPI0037A2D5C8
MVAFAAERLLEDWNTAEAAGHGVTLSAQEAQSHMTVGWTRLQQDGNVRLIYDVRFLNRFTPRAVLADIERKCTVLESGDEHAVRTLVQEWAGHHRFDPAWKVAPAHGRLLERLEALAAGPAPADSGGNTSPPDACRPS